MNGADDRPSRAALYAAVAVIALLVVVAIGGGAITPYDPAAQPDIVHGKNLPPSGAHPFGTDSYSRDVLSRVMAGTGNTFEVAALSVLVAVAIGAAIGAASGYAGGRTDRWVSRAVDVVLAMPRLLVLIVLAAALGQLHVTGLILALGLTGWPGVSRIVRAQVRDVAALDYVTAARALGVPPRRILVRHVLPAVAPTILVAATLAVATVIPLEAGLSFLGFGIPAPNPSWGNIMFDGYDQGLHTWWLLVFPGVAIVATVLAVNVIGDRLRAVFDPRLRTPV